jgi:hypothetical protein
MNQIFRGHSRNCSTVAETKKNMTSVKVNINPFTFIRNYCRAKSSEGFSALENKHHDMSSEGCAARPQQNILKVTTGKRFAGLFYTNWLVATLKVVKTL